MGGTLTWIRWPRARRSALEPEPTLTVIIPSIGYPTLDRTIRSIRAQRLVPGDEVLVIGDGPQPRSRAAVEAAGPPFVYDETGPTRQWGNAQRNHGLGRARGDYIVWMDEDDVFAPRAFNRIRRAAQAFPGRPLLFRFRTTRGKVLWREKEVRKDHIGGHEIVTPNVAGRVGRWGDRYEGDFDFITSTLARYPPDSVVWRREVIAVCRPNGKAPVLPPPGS